MQSVTIVSTVFNKLLLGKNNIRTYAVSGIEETAK